MLARTQTFLSVSRLQLVCKSNRSYGGQTKNVNQFSHRSSLLCPQPQGFMETTASLCSGEICEGKMQSHCYCSWYGAIGVSIDERVCTSANVSCSGRSAEVIHHVITSYYSLVDQTFFFRFFPFCHTWKSMAVRLCKYYCNEF